MPITPDDIKSDIIGSYFVQGQASNRYDRANRRIRVRALTNAAGDANTDFLDAINAVIAKHGQYHHEDTSLPARWVHVRRKGLTQAIVNIDYARGIWSTPGSSAYTLAEFRDHSAPVQWFRHTFGAGGLAMWGGAQTAIDGSHVPNNTPDGLMIYEDGGAGFDPGKRPMPWIWDRPAHRMFVPTVLDFNPVFAVNKLKECINNVGVTFAGLKFDRYTMRFDGVNVRVVDTQQGPLFFCMYAFTIVYSGWWNQTVYFDTANAPPGGSGQWRSRCGLAYRPVSFFGQFPIHG